MANLTITEYRKVGRDLEGSPLPAGEEPALIHQNITFSTSAVQSSAFNGSTRFVRVSADADCRILIGNDPTVANNTGALLVAGQTEFFGINTVQGPYKISVVESV